MHDEAYQAYCKETSSWLHCGRTHLICRLLKQHCPKKCEEILEVGAGAGQNIETLNRFGIVDALEINPHGLDWLRQRGDLRTVYEQPIPCTLGHRYDVLGAFDVLEHLEQDRDALLWMFEQLNPGGILLVTVPAYQWLFSDHDRSVGHYRRYYRKQLLALVPQGCQVVQCSYFNMLLFPLAVISRAVWQAKRALCGRTAIAKQRIPVLSVMGTFFEMVLDFESWLIQKGCCLPWGLSVVLCLRKTTENGNKSNK